MWTFKVFYAEGNPYIQARLQDTNHWMQPMGELKSCHIPALEEKWKKFWIDKTNQTLHMLTDQLDTRYWEKPKNPSPPSPHAKQKKAGNPQKIIETQKCNDLQKNNNNPPPPSPAVGHQKTIDWNTKAGEKLTQNVKEAAQDASIRGNL